MFQIEQFSTIKSFSEFLYKEKNSEFIAHAYPVETEEEALKILSKIRKTHYNATHHCYAIKLINNYLKYSDDGEPNGTAGIRILNAIDHFQLKNVLVIVIRYFGGIKLGIGPLGKAYYTAAEEVLKNCEKVQKEPLLSINITADFNLISQVHHAAGLYKAKIVKTEYFDKVNFECLIKPELFENLKNYLFEVSRGTIEVTNSDKILFL
jgi:uncharacterized YigZ family protein